MSSCVIQAPILHPRAFACARKCPTKNITNPSKSWNLANLWTPQALTDPGTLSGPTNIIIKHPSLLSHFTDAHPVLDGPSRRWALHQGWSGWPNALSPYDLRCPSPLHYTPHLHARPTKQIMSVAVHTTEIYFIQDCCILSLLWKERNSWFPFRSDSSVVPSIAKKWRSFTFEASCLFILLLLHSDQPSRSLIFRSFGDI